MLARRLVSNGLRRGPIADPEMWVAYEKHFCLSARLLKPSKLRQTGCEDTARGRSVGFFLAEGLDGSLILAHRILGLPEQPVVPACRMRIESHCRAPLFDSFRGTATPRCKVGQ